MSYPRSLFALAQIAILVGAASVGGTEHRVPEPLAATAGLSQAAAGADTLEAQRTLGAAAFGSASAPAVSAVAPETSAGPSANLVISPAPAQPTNPPPPAEGAPVPTEEKGFFSKAWDGTKAFVKEHWRAIGGAGLGAVGGFLVGGPWGAVAGALVGGAAGHLSKSNLLLGGGMAYGAVIGGLVGGPVGILAGAAVGALGGMFVKWIFS